MYLTAHYSVLAGKKKSSMFMGDKPNSDDPEEKARMEELIKLSKVRSHPGGHKSVFFHTKDDEELK